MELTEKPIQVSRCKLILFVIMRKLSLVFVALLTVSAAFAQISTGEPHSSVIPRTGNRPQAGDFGFYLGASVTQIMDLVQLNNNAKFPNMTYWALPAMNIKYYFTDNIEGRIGFEFACQSETDKIKKDDYAYTNSYNRNFTRFLPGAAYHFNTNNILDVYVGAQIPIGFNVAENFTKVDDVSARVKENMFVIGAGIFGGLQVFVADLPFAIGLEIGYSGRATFSGGERTIFRNGSDKQVDVVLPDGTAATDIKSASHMAGTWGADAAITFSYYFHK